MYNEIVLARLYTCLDHINAIIKYFNAIQQDSISFQNDELHYDAILMRLQALGENLKRIDKKHPEVIVDLGYTEIDDVIRFRDYVSHHYEQLETEVIFDICKNKIPVLENCITTLIKQNEI